MIWGKNLGREIIACIEFMKMNVTIKKMWETYLPHRCKYTLELDNLSLNERQLLAKYLQKMLWRELIVL